MECTGKTKVWLSGAGIGFDYLETLFKEGEFDRLVSRLQYTSIDMSGNAGWVLLGEAEITVRIKPKEEITKGVVEALRGEIQLIKAESQRKVEKLEEKIQSLLALPNATTNDLDG